MLKTKRKVMNNQTGFVADTLLGKVEDDERRAAVVAALQELYDALETIKFQTEGLNKNMKELNMQLAGAIGVAKFVVKENQPQTQLGVPVKWIDSSQRRKSRSTGKRVLGVEVKR